MNPYEELAEFLGRGPSAAEIADYHLSDESSEWFETLIHKEKTSRLTDEEHHTLERLMEVERIMRLVKAHARRHVAAEGSGVADQAAAEAAAPAAVSEGLAAV